MSAKTYKCPFLNDRVPKVKTIASECTTEDEANCPKIRSMKLAVNPQCWKLKPAGEKKPKAEKPAGEKPVAKKGKEKPAEKPAEKPVEKPGEKPAESLALVKTDAPADQ